jgi:hypothetical protein
MWDDLYSDLVKEEGCSACGTRTSISYYVVELEFVPEKLVRQKHRALHRARLFCKSCYEANGDLEILVAGAPVRVPKKGIIPESDVKCFRCRSAFVPGQGLYGFLNSIRWISGPDNTRLNIVRLATWCPLCVEGMLIEMASKG